ncbi:MAG: hypothetical protein Q7J57_04530 [Gemmobacter sp.]|nr:hypothetical protein [Gemmobacter sp.]
MSTWDRVFVLTEVGNSDAPKLRVALDGLEETSIDAARGRKPMWR